MNVGYAAAEYIFALEESSTKTQGAHANFLLLLRTYVIPFTYVIDIRRGSRIQKGGFVQEFRLENRSYPDVHDFSLRMQVIIAND